MTALTVVMALLISATPCDWMVFDRFFVTLSRSADLTCSGPVSSQCLALSTTFVT